MWAVKCSSSTSSKELSRSRSIGPRSSWPSEGNSWSLGVCLSPPPPLHPLLPFCLFTLLVPTPLEFSSTFLSLIRQPILPPHHLSTTRQALLRPSPTDGRRRGRPRARGVHWEEIEEVVGKLDRPSPLCPYPFALCLFARISLCTLHSLRHTISPKSACSPTLYNPSHIHPLPLSFFRAFFFCPFSTSLHATGFPSTTSFCLALSYRFPQSNLARPIRYSSPSL
jgi:hypothetical protein